MPDAPTTLYRSARVLSPDDPAATALLVSGGAVAWVGRDPQPHEDGVDEVVDLAGQLVTPAFVDAHVHTTSTGLALTGLDLTGATSLADCLDRVEKAGRAGRGRVVLGHGWDESGWPEGRPPTRQELDRATYGGVAYLSRVDVHSAVVSSALLAAAPEARTQPGFDDSGHLTRDAHHVVRRMARESVTPEQRRAVQRTALARAATLGVGCVHELAGPDISSVDDLRALLALVGEEPGPELVPYWGQAGADGIATARELGAAGAAGDLFADGSIGSHTAYLRAPYADADHAGHGYLDAAEVRDHVVACTRAGLQAGFHAIGDGALVEIWEGLELAEQQLGTAAVRSARHRIEHLEMPPPEMLPVLARLGVVASVQPAFDRLWGGPDGMYARRLGVDRALGLNPFAAMAAAGVTVALGSDSPVTPVDPWGSVLAAVRHHTEGSGLPTAEAFAAHTRGGWLAARRDADGVLTAGAPATFAVWDLTGAGGGLDEGGLSADGLPTADRLAVGAPTCRRTVVRGRTIHAA
ncbi:MAG TPA: amidohydrolase family protein [Actinomycetes bacterium]|nr:amidohydrolase family protein [Actinomycetes bacterium]